MLYSSKHHWSRRRFLFAGALVPWLATCLPRSSLSSNEKHESVLRLRRRLAVIEDSTGGRIGVAAINLATGIGTSYRGDERFAMCSTFKWLLGASVLRRVELGVERLDRTLSWGADDLITWSPVTKPLVEGSAGGQASLSVGELCHATLSTSDNTAANLLLDTMGGPAGLTRALREFGDTQTRLDRYEPQLNENAPNDVRDTSTPDAMLSLMQTLLFGDALSLASVAQLRAWMVANVTGNTRLRAGLPDDWLVGDRTGTSSNNANNNLAFAIPPADAATDRGPLLIVSFTNAPDPTTPQANEVHARIARAIVDSLSGP